MRIASYDTGAKAMQGSSGKRRNTGRPRGADPLDTPELPIAVFGSGEVAEMIGIPVWRLQQIVSDKSRYPIQSSTRSAAGRGTRRLFSHIDVHRLGLTAALQDDGFSSSAIAQILEELDDSDVLSMTREAAEAHVGLALRRTEKGFEVEKYDVRMPPPASDSIEEGAIYYRLNLAQLSRRTNQKILAINDKYKGETRA